MSVDAKKIFKKLKGDESRRGRVTLYLDKVLYSDFRTRCKDLTPSKVMEELMREFIASTKKQK